MNTLITGSSGLLGSCFDFGFKPSRQEVDLYNFEQLQNYIKDNNISNMILYYFFKTETKRMLDLSPWALPHQEQEE